MADISLDMDEHMRAERQQALVRRLLPIAAAVVLLTLAVVGLWQYLAWRSARRDEAASTRYFAADTLAQHALPGGILDRATAQAARDAFIGAQRDAPDGVRVLAGLRIAGLDAALGDKAAARQVWAAIAADAQAGLPQRQLATLLDVQSRIGEGRPAELIGRLQKLSEPGAPWQALAQETQALIDIQAGDIAAARGLLQMIEFSADAPLGARQRAQGMLQTLPEPRSATPATTPASAPSRNDTRR